MLLVHKSHLSTQINQALAGHLGVELNQILDPKTSTNFIYVVFIKKFDNNTFLYYKNKMIGTLSNFNKNMAKESKV